MQFKMAIPRPAFQASSFHATIWRVGRGKDVPAVRYNMEWHFSLPLTLHWPELGYMLTCNCKEVGKWNPHCRWQGAQLKSGESIMIKKGRMNIEGQLAVASLPLVLRIVSFKDI